MTYEEYLAAKAEFDRMNKAIDDAPLSAKPVFPGIVELQDRLIEYEMQNGLRAR